MPYSLRMGATGSPCRTAATRSTLEGDLARFAAAWPGAEWNVDERAYALMAGSSVGGVYGLQPAPQHLCATVDTRKLTGKWAQRLEKFCLPVALPPRCFTWA
jgi:hypothetical protein